MNDKFLTIQQAAKLSGKSIQTIRRAIKAKKIKFRKKKTPQGFNYSISESALSEKYNLNLSAKIENTAVKKEAVKELKEEKVETKKEVVSEKSEQKTIDMEDFKSFAKTMERLVSQHAEERQSFLRLVNTLQEKIFVLENQVNLLNAPKKKWYQMWK